MINTAFEDCGSLASLAFAVGDQGAAHAMFLTVIDKSPEGLARLLYAVAMQVEARLDFVLSHAQIFVDAMLYAGAGELQRVECCDLFDNAVWVEEVTVGLYLELCGFATFGETLGLVRQTWGQRLRPFLLRVRRHRQTVRQTAWSSSWSCSLFSALSLPEDIAL